MSAQTLLQVGQLAPDFSADAEPAPITLSALRGQRVILYFYPKDATPGCTTQACDLRDHLGRLSAAGYVVIGVSGDSLKSHARFRQAHELPFTLVSDPDRAIASAYGVWRQKISYGKPTTGLVRSTFVLDEQGVITHLYDAVRVKGHVERLLAELAVP